MLDPENLARHDASGAKDTLTYVLKDGTTEVVERVSLVQDMAQSDGKQRNYTVKRIAELAIQDKPFFIEHAFMKIHPDKWPSAAFKAASASKTPVREALVDVDSYIGDVAKALETAGELENTFIFVTSDNGPQKDSWPSAVIRRFSAPKAPPERAACACRASPIGSA